MHTVYRRFSLLSVLILAIAGCDSGPKRYGISGSITLQGKPLDSGMITFVSPDGSATVSASIVNGKYAIADDKGVVPGNYKVSINAPDGKTPDADPTAPPGPSGNFTSKNRVPKEYNLESKLEFEVKSSGKNVFDCTIP